jgi:hypothetical protein
VKRALNCVITVMLWTTPAQASKIALGDSLAVGFGQASHVTTIAKVGISSCCIVGMVPAGYYDEVLISAGTNDPPGHCIEQIRERIHAGKVLWVVPVNGARGHVLQVAAEHGDALVYYTPGRKSWPHPNRYWKVI